MNTLEKVLGAAAAIIAVVGTVMAVMGFAEAGIIAACMVGLCGLFLLAQLLRESRQQKRSIELLREAEKKSRAAIAEARLEGVHARNDVVGQTRKIRADLRDQFGKSNRRDAALADAIGAEAMASRNALTAIVIKEARGTRTVLRDSTSRTVGRIAEAEELMLGRMDARTRQVRQQAVDERTAIVREMTKLEGRVNSALTDSVDTATAYQQVTTQKLIAQQDGLRRVVNLVRQGLAELQDNLSLLATAESVSELDGTMTAVRGSISDLGSHVTGLQNSLSELETSVDEQLHNSQSRMGLLTENARGLSEQVLGIGDKLAELENKRAQISSPAMVEIGERLSSLRRLDSSKGAIEVADIDVVVASHRAALDQLRQMLNEVRSSETLSRDEKEHLMSALYFELGMQDVAQENVLDVGGFEIGVSFRAQMVRLMHLKDRLATKGYEISPRENDKMQDRAFAEALGVPTPTLLFHDVPTGDVKITPNSIIKPVVGESSRGVFFVKADGGIYSLKTRNVYTDFAEAAAEYSRWYGELQEPRWIGESAVLDASGEPARDIKVYAFYGEIGMYVEVVRFGDNVPRPIAATYDAEGERIMFRDSDDRLRSVEIPQGVAEMASRISHSSPVPFVRVDFLIGDDGPVLGEITPHPGGIYAGDASDQYDRMLGKMFLEAEARLTVDLLHGKKFSTYFDAYGVGSGPVDKAF